MLHISQIAEACKGKWLQEAADTEIRFISTDSRKINDPEHALFAAIKTERRDGHDHIGEAYNKGVRNFLVTSEPVLADFPGASFILVNSTVAALQIIAAAIRNRFEIPVIGITGSNGKTIVKEWLFQLLQQDHNVIRSPKSYNSQIGVPLSVWQMNDEHSLAIFEAGISQPDEMGHLEQVMRPTIGVFTNIGEAHSQGFLNARQKINEKLQLFRHTDTLVYCRDYHELHECVLLYTHLLQTNLKKELKLFSWSYKHEATLQVKEVTKADGRTQISALYQGRLLQTSIPFTDAASIENAINCWCVLLLLGVEDHTIAARMWELKPIAMRLELRQGENNCSIINDAYNSDITSLQVALDLLDQQKQQKRTIVLSDIQQAGKADHILYTEVADILSRRKISRFFGIGKGLVQQRHLFEAVPGMECHFFPATEDFVKQMPGFVFEDEAILLKGARSFAFEQISLVLEQKIHQTVMSISLSALRHNLEVFRGRLKTGVRTMAMVKAASYGTGGYEIARTLQESGVDYLTVAYPDEGVALRREGITLPIMVMSPSTISFDRMIIWNLEPELFNLRSLNQFLEIARKLQVTDYPVHIKLDTGMHRLGFSPEEVPALLQALKGRPELKIASIFSHLAASDDASFDDFTTQQADAFIAMSEEIIAAIGYRPLRHLCNTAGIAAYPEYHFDMVRLGLGLYGIDSSNILTTELQQISTLRTTIAQIKQVPAGDTIGYSRKGKAEQDMRIATICIGYADGYPRALNNGKSYVMINNRPAPLVGVIAMDMCMVDITAIDGVQEGDEVIIFGPQLSIRQLAEWAGTISYEIMTGISQRVKRVYVNEAE